MTCACCGPGSSCYYKCKLLYSVGCYTYPQAQADLANQCDPANSYTGGYGCGNVTTMIVQDECDPGSDPPGSVFYTVLIYCCNGTGSDFDNDYACVKSCTNLDCGNHPWLKWGNPTHISVPQPVTDIGTTYVTPSLDHGMVITSSSNSQCADVDCCDDLP
jgi:hypothetical protein